MTCARRSSCRLQRPARPPRRRPEDDAVFISARIAAALYDTPWVKTAIYLAITIVVARVVDELLARRDRAITAMLKRAPGPSERTRFRMIRRLVWISILFVGGAIALSVLPGI